MIIRTIFWILLALPGSLFCQQRFYALAYGGVGEAVGLSRSLYGISLGAQLNEKLTLGAGAAYTKIARPYIPLTVDFSYTYRPGKISPVALIRAGYGIYHRTSFASTEIGGFTSSVMMGLLLPHTKHLSSFIMAGYNSYYTTLKGRRDQFREVLYADRFSIVVGLKI